MGEEGEGEGGRVEKEARHKGWLERSETENRVIPLEGIHGMTPRGGIPVVLGNHVVILLGNNGVTVLNPRKENEDPRE